MASNGKFIVLEGIDGCGKTTIATLLAKKLGNTWITKEPTSANKKIQAILRHQQSAPSPLELQKLYIADRLSHTKKIKRILETRNVICQRYAMSTFAYGTAFGVSQKDLQHDFLKPDMTFLLDIPVELAMKRIAGRKQDREYFEKKEKLAKIRKKYLALDRKKIFGKIIKIDARPAPEIIAKKILWHIQ